MLESLEFAGTWHMPGTALIRDARSASRARGADAPNAMAAPHGTAAMGASASGDDKKKAFEMAKQVSCACARYASFADSKRLLGSCRRWNIASSCLGSA